MAENCILVTKKAEMDLDMYISKAELFCTEEAICTVCFP